MLHVSKSVTIRRPREEVYRFWRDIEKLPRFMQHLESVQALDERRSHWVAKGPAGALVEWDAEIVEDRVNELISWRSLPDSDVGHQGSVRFRTAPGDRGTEIDLELQYDPPGGRAAAALAKLFGEEPTQQVRDDLRRLKQVMETGDIVRSEGSLEGAGQGPTKQRPAQAPSDEETTR